MALAAGMLAGAVVVPGVVPEAQAAVTIGASCGADGTYGVVRRQFGSVGSEYCAIIADYTYAGVLESWTPPTQLPSFSFWYIAGGGGGGSAATSGGVEGQAGLYGGNGGAEQYNGSVAAGTTLTYWIGKGGDGGVKNGGATNGAGKMGQNTYVTWAGTSVGNTNLQATGGSYNNQYNVTSNWYCNPSGQSYWPGYGKGGCGAVYSGLGTADGEKGADGALIVLYTPPAPSAPSGLAATNSSTVGNLDVSWTASTSTFARKYTVDATSSSGDPGSCSTSAVSGEVPTSCTIAGLTLGATYTITVTPKTALDATGTSASLSNVQVLNPPVNTPGFPPIISGSGGKFAVGTPITTTDGTWSGKTPIEYAYAWEECTTEAASDCSVIAGATSSSFTPTSSQAGRYIRSKVTASNSDGDGVAYSVPAPNEQITEMPVFTAANPPAIADAPTIAVPGGYFAGYEGFAADGFRIEYSIDTSGSLTGLPDGVVLDPSTGDLSGAPDGTPGGDAGVYTYRVTARNDSGSATTSVLTLTVSTGTVDKLVITQQPVGGPSRQVLSTPPIVEALDVGDRLIASPQTVVVTSTGLIGGSEAAGKATDAGVVEFTNLTLGGLVNTDYTLTFTTGSVAVTSDPTQVTSGAATNLQITAQPEAAAAAGAVMTTQPVVEIRDADTNLVTSDNSTVVTLTPENGGFVGPTQSSTATATASGGVATFSGVRFGGPVNTGKTLTFSSGSLTPAVSNPVMSTATGEAYKLVLTTNATTPSPSGAAFATSPVVTRQDMAGNTVSGAPQVTVTASMSPRGTYQSLVGDTESVTVSGVATFVGLGISGDKDTDYTLTFSSPGLVSAEQNPVRPSVGAASGLSLTATGAQQPAGARYGEDLTQQPKLQIIDSGNNVVAVNGVVVTATVASGDGTITNNTATTDANGLATWTAMRLSGVAGPFTMSFSAPGYGTVTSAEFQLQKALQTVTFNSLSAKTVGDAPFGISATSSADLVITYSSDTPDVCGVSSTGTATGTTPKATAGLVSILAGGTCTITALQAGDDYYDVASATQSFTVNKANQATLTVVAPATVTAGQTVELYSLGGSGTGDVSFAEASDSGSICDVTSAGVVTFSGNGNSCSFTATKAGDDSYNPTTSAAATITIPSGSATPSGLSIQSVAFTSQSPATARVGDTYTATAATSSGLTPSLSIAAGSVPVCSISGAGASETVTFLTPGTCQIQASSVATSRFAAADPDAFQTIRVIAVGAPAGTLNQSISFTQPSDIMMGAADVALTATASSGLAVTFTSTTTGVCTVTSGGVAHPVSVGTCTIVAAQAGNATYEAADSVARSFLVTAGVPSAPFITSLSAGNGSVTVSFLAPGYDGGATIDGYRLVATPTSGSAVTSNGCTTTSPCVLTGLTNGTSYAITMAAINSVGIGAYGSGGSVTPLDAPGSPRNPSANRSGTSVTLTWSQPVLASGVTFIRYDIFQRVSGTSSWGSAIDSVAPISVTTYIVTGLDANVNYDFRILSITEPMTVPEDDAASVVESSRINAPGAPRSLATNRVSGSTILVTWAAPASNGGSAITGYSVSFIPSGSCGAVTMDNTTFSASCSASGLAEGTTFTISVRATNAQGTGNAATITYRTSGGGSGGGGGGDTGGGGSSGAGTDPIGPNTPDLPAGGPGNGSRPPFPPNLPTPGGPTKEQGDEAAKKPSTGSVSDLPTIPIVKGTGPMPGGDGSIPPRLRNNLRGAKAWPTSSPEMAAALAAGRKVVVVAGTAEENYMTSRKITVVPETMLQVTMQIEPGSDIEFRLWMQDREGTWFRMGSTTAVMGQLVFPVIEFTEPGTYQVVATSVDGGSATMSTRAGEELTPVWGSTTVRTIVIVTPRQEMGTKMCPNTVSFDNRSALLSKQAKRDIRKLAECLGAMPKITVTGYVGQAIRPDAAKRMAYLRARNVRNYLRELGYDGGAKVQRSIVKRPTECNDSNNRCSIVRLELGQVRSAEKSAWDLAVELNAPTPVEPLPINGAAQPSGGDVGTSSVELAEEGGPAPPGDIAT